MSRVLTSEASAFLHTFLLLFGSELIYVYGIDVHCIWVAFHVRVLIALSELAPSLLGLQVLEFESPSLLVAFLKHAR